jgi:hypothetical protein
VVVGERFVFVFIQGGWASGVAGEAIRKHTNSTLTFMAARMASRSAAIMLSTMKVMWWEPLSNTAGSGEFRRSRTRCVLVVSYSSDEGGSGSRIDAIRGG